MDENGEDAKIRSGEVDRLSKLPDSLIYEVLLKLPTKEVVKTSLLSRRWQNLWKSVPGLDLDNRDFPNYDAFVGFVNWFLVNNESYMRNFKVEFCGNDDKDDEPDWNHFETWINNMVVERKIQQLDFVNRFWDDEEIVIPPTVYTCQSLVSLELFDVWLPTPEFVSLPCVKVIKLDVVTFVNDLAFEMLVSGCPVLESLLIERSWCDNVRVLRVCSRSLLSFTIFGHYTDDIGVNQVVVIDAPKLEYLKLVDHKTSSFIIQNAGSIVKANINIVFNSRKFDPDNQPKRNMIRNFLIVISNVKVMKFSSQTLEVIYNYSRYQRLPLFRNLSSLHANFSDYRWQMLPIFLESCPNLKHISLKFCQSPGEQPISILPGPYCHLPTLESVEIVYPMIDDEAEMNLVSYFLENSLILKTLTLFVDPYRKNKTSDILKKFLTVPRLSPSCQVTVSGPKSFWILC